MTSITSRYESHLSNLKDTFTKFKADWSELYASRTSLIEDVKTLMLQLDYYRGVILDLEGKIEMHNRTVGGNESNLKQNIESLTRTSLAKKSIEIKSNIDNLLRCSEDMETLKTKVKRIEMNKFSGSQCLGSIATDLQNIVTSEETTVVKTSVIITSDSFTNVLKN